jgi:hypothetical protein
MKESNTWEWLRDVALPLGQYSRIESPDTAPGFPDIHYQIDMNACGTIELKCNRHNAKIPFPNEVKGLHRSQLRWIEANVARWGTVWVIAEVRHCIYVIHGTEADRINGSTNEELAELASAIVYREKPEEATKILNSLLTTWKYGK